VCSVGVVRAEGEATLGDMTAMSDRAVLGMGSAPIGQEPPAVGRELPSVALAEVHPCLVMVSHAGEGEQPKCTQRQ
jgi:hypothetical protein